MFLILPKRDLRRNTIACRRSFVREKERFSFKLPNSFAQIKIFFFKNTFLFCFNWCVVKGCMHFSCNYGSVLAVCSGLPAFCI